MESKHEFYGLIDLIEENLEHVMTENDSIDQLWMQTFMAYINDTCYIGERKEINHVTLQDLNQNLQKEHLPYWFVSKIAEDGSIVFKGVRWRESYCMGSNVIDVLMRYLRSLSEKPIDSSYIGIHLRSIKTLYDATFGEFYINDKTRIYSTKELNTMFMRKNIPFQIIDYKSAKEGYIQLYHEIKEVNL